MESKILRVRKRKLNVAEEQMKITAIATSVIKAVVLFVLED